jgi:quercetin dioxygenase-like cupin family protein
MPKSHELICSVLDVLPLQEELLKHYDEFDKINLRRLGNSPHKEMTDIWVRYNHINNYSDDILNGTSKFNEEHDAVWYPVTDKIPSVKKVCFDLMFTVDGERLGGIFITKLPPGGRIEKHTDDGWHAQYYDKFYVPILNKQGAKFCFEDGDINPTLGDAWWFDNSKVHWVENNTDSDRIAMIVCIRTDKFKEKNARRIG